MKTRHILALVIGCLLALPGVGLLLAGGGLAIGALAQGEDGYLDATLDTLRSDGVAITAEGILLVVEPDTPGWVLEALEVDTRLVVDAADGERAVFVGIAPEADVDAYLADAAHSEIVSIDGRTPEYDQRSGEGVIDAPTDQDFWEVSTSGPGAQTLDWRVADGRWAVAVMNADGSPGVATDVEVGVRAGFLWPLAATLLLLGLAVTAVAVTLIVVGARGDGASRPMPVRGTEVPPPALAAGRGAHPVSLNAQLDPALSRGLWVIKWVLAIPHFVVLAFLWLAFVLLTMVAGVAILFTGTYPRSIFDFNVGVLRWSWRVSYYATSGGIGTDRYPPFSLADDPAYPARLHIAYPERLSRGLVLVKWWLLAIPHYIIVGILLGGGLGWTSSDGWGCPSS